MTLLRVRDREVVGALCEPDPHRRHRDPAAVQDLEKLGEALAALTEQVPFRDDAVGEVSARVSDAFQPILSSGAEIS